MSFGCAVLPLLLPACRLFMHVASVAIIGAAAGLVVNGGIDAS